MNQIEVLRSFQNRETSYYGERRLWVATLIQAIEDLNPKCEAVGEGNTEINKKRIRQSAISWFKSSNNLINSFVGICEMLNMCPDTARRRILNGKGDKR